MNNVGCRLWGKCWGDPANPVRLVVKWAGQQVFDGAAPTSGDQPNATRTDHHEVLCSWTANNVTTGTVPVEITVHNGSATINNVLLSNIVSGRYVHFKHDMADIGNLYHPEPPREDINVRTYTEHEFVGYYGFTMDAPPNYVEYVDTPAQDTWVDGNFNRRMKNGSYTDGKLNVKLNGTARWTALPPPPDPAASGAAESSISGLQINQAVANGQNVVTFTPVGAHLIPGERNYLVNDGDTLSFDYLIEWDIT